MISLAILGSICALVFPFPVLIQPALEHESGESVQDGDEGVQHGKETSEPFPCQDRPCGCRSASQCWKKCCCFTNAQKIAWAKSHGVAVPDFVIVAAGQEEKSSSPVRSCCAKRAEKAPRSKYVIGIMAEECQGLNWLLAAVPVVTSQTPQPSTNGSGSGVDLIDVASERLPEMPTDAMRLPPRIG
jgi:hypothetical protein